MKIMLFETNLNGHRLEYIHHIYMGMLEYTEHEYVIVVPKEFEEKKMLYKWPKAAHVKFCFFTEKNERNEEGMGLIRHSFHLTKVLRKYVKQEKVESVFLISLIDYIIALPFLISSKVNIVGIIYNIYLYIWDSSSWRRRMQDVCKYIIMSMTPCLKTIFILNDKSAASRFNKLYYTHKFKFITDPYNVLDYQPRSLRKELKISDEDRVYLHFGGLSRRKGTLDILNAVLLIPLEQRRSSVFVFAGKVYDDLKEEFYQLIDLMPSETRMLIYDEFCSNEFLADLCISSDFILAPYHITNCSSGLLGHAAYYGRPVIGPNDGLIGKIIKEYNLGITLSQNSPQCIAKIVAEVVPYRIESEYIEKINVQNFINDIFLYL